MQRSNHNPDRIRDTVVTNCCFGIGFEGIGGVGPDEEEDRALRTSAETAVHQIASNEATMEVNQKL